ncbi:LacI family DNA-binding transcriptional regulator [Enemella evansiae]|uniref:LacI family DNA-binding transcriptional regulator n=1 Tax=Enemella evansiae TaxID=2016499 RepID=UPI000B95F0C3|nr:LacI family DNA-binding transcriptional regulator [Enemella evansiae]OYO01213.1 LacI family transcriptional regulator [Enemella evansiae]OYO12531.1 LacI family transcriptional regulator [Enemella evansiae]TDO93452.1 LacI family transcriptional regulator [Enemella evansiae]
MERRGGRSIKGVAREAGVSIATVSRAINHPDQVSEPTRRKVLEAIRRLDYRPSAEMADRARGAGARIAVLAPFSSYGSYAERLNGIFAVVQPRGMEALVRDQPSSAAAIEPHLDSLPLRSDVAGVIVMGVPVSGDGAARLEESRLPVVLVDSDHPAFSRVEFDDTGAGRLIAEHLLGLGHRQAYFVHEPQAADFRSAGLVRSDAIQAAGLPLTSVPVTPDFGEAVRRLDHWLGGLSDGGAFDAGPVAVVANHDRLGAAVLAAARGRGLQVPEQLRVIGVDDGEIAAVAGLTTIRQPFAESGRLAADLLLAQLADRRRPPARVLLSGELVLRAST